MCPCSMQRCAATAAGPRGAAPQRRPAAQLQATPKPRACACNLLRTLTSARAFRESLSPGIRADGSGSSPRSDTWRSSRQEREVGSGLAGLALPPDESLGVKVTNGARLQLVAVPTSLLGRGGARDVAAIAVGRGGAPWGGTLCAPKRERPLPAPSARRQPLGGSFQLAGARASRRPTYRTPCGAAQGDARTTRPPCPTPCSERALADPCMDMPCYGTECSCAPSSSRREQPGGIHEQALPPGSEPRGRSSRRTFGRVPRSMTARKRSCRAFVLCVSLLMPGTGMAWLCAEAHACSVLLTNRMCPVPHAMQRRPPTAGCSPGLEATCPRPSASSGPCHQARPRRLPSAAQHACHALSTRSRCSSSAPSRRSGRRQQPSSWQSTATPCRCQRRPSGGGASSPALSRSRRSRAAQQPQRG